LLIDLLIDGKQIIKIFNDNFDIIKK
jgi:hypothetical protein